MSHDYAQPCKGPKIRDMMIFRPVHVGPTTAVGDAWKVMQENHIRHLPVGDADHKLAGLLTQRDLLALVSFQTAGRPTQAHEVMVHIVEAVRADTCQFTAAKFMAESKKSCLPVIDEEGRLLGVLTEAHCVQLAAAQAVACKGEPQRHVGGLS